MSILETATAVLRLMALRQSEVTMTDLVEHLSMPKSSASRVLKQMAEEGLLVRNSTTLAYRPSLLLLELAHIVRSSTPLIEMCAQAMDTLGTETGHTGYISLLDHNDVVVLRVRPGSQALRAMTNAGRRLPSWATSTGRALLARESDAQIRERFRRPVMKVIRVGSAADVTVAERYLGVADRLLFDAQPPKRPGAVPGGNGEPFDWSLLAGRSWPLPWMLSGGLTIGNIAEAVRTTGAPAIDVSSGVETSPGIKDVRLIEDFIAMAKQLG